MTAVLHCLLIVKVDSATVRSFILSGLYDKQWYDFKTTLYSGKNLNRKKEWKIKYQTVQPESIELPLS